MNTMGIPIPKILADHARAVSREIVKKQMTFSDAIFSSPAAREAVTACAIEACTSAWISGWLDWAMNNKDPSQGAQM